MAAKRQSVHHNLELELEPKVKLSKSAQAFSIELQRFTQEELTRFQTCLVGETLQKVQKSTQCDQIARLLDFPTQQAFDAFFSCLPPYLQKLIQAGCYNQYIDTRSQDWEVGEPLIIEDTKHYYYYYNTRFRPNSKYRLGLFTVYDQYVLYLDGLFANLFRPFLYKEENYIPRPLDRVESQVWSVENQIHEVFPLFVESLIPLIKKRDLNTIIRKGLLKGNIKDLRALCGLPPFPLSSEYNLDPLVLLAKFVLTFGPNTLTRPDDGMAMIKTLVQSMLFMRNPKTNLNYGSFFEYYSLLDQCSLSGGYSYSTALDDASRKNLVKALTSLQVGPWYSVNELFESSIIHGFFLQFSNQDILYSALTIRGQRIQLPYAEYTAYDDKGFHPTGALLRPLFERPLFSAYLYLFASLGLFDIGETKPELLLTKNDKLHPLTPYEALTHVRLTSFGAWCLNMVEERPQQKKQVFETITDTELLLVTIKGKSLERRLFLDQIGIPLGQERYRITEASFIRGCTSSSEILHRIKKFKLIIDAEPSARWLQFFQSVERRSSLFAHGEQVLLYSFPDDPEIRRMFSTDPAFKKLVIRAENNNVVVRKANQKAFQKLLMEHGYLNTL